MNQRIKLSALCPISALLISASLSFQSNAGEDIAGRAANAAVAESPQLTFEKDIKPILRAHCLDCHGGVEGKKGKLDLRLVRTMVSGGETGAAIEPGNPDESYLVARIEDGEMPPKGAGLKPEELKKLKDWIAAGAKTARAEPAPESLGVTLGLTAEERAYWAFQPIVQAPVPQVKGAEVARTAIDRFLLARLEPLGLSFRPDADKTTLIRRVTLDLTGLPPSPAEVREFLADTRPDAYERLVDRLLASPRYGERWARHWMDVAGYADSDGGSAADTDRPHAWRYRDWLIRAFNDDKPLDRFLLEQMAGDELVPRPWTNLSKPQVDLLTATGFLRMPADPTAADYSEIARNQVMADTIKVVTSTTLGLSVACAQCHDHRYDPISHVDYYRLRAMFEPALHWEGYRQPGARVLSLYSDRDRDTAAKVEAEVKPLAEKREAYQADAMKRALAKELEKYQEPLKGQLKAAADTPADKRTPEMNKLLDANPSVKISPGVLYQYLPDAAEELKKMDAAIAAVRAKKPPENFIAIYDEPAGKAPPATKRLHRGDYRQPLEEVQAGVPEVMKPEGAALNIDARPETGHSTGRRLAFARWLFSDENPLTARVLANRIWMHHFGRGLVATAGEFGKLGEPPTHPELLDHLASELKRNSWRTKSLHRAIVTSTAYRQESARDMSTASGEADADGRWLSRYPVHRLEAETIRDRVLAASGRLDTQMFGPPVDVQADDSGQVVIAGESPRRSIYVKQKRSQPVSLMAAFDAPVMETHCERRTSATVATQSLMLLNGAFVLEEAKKLATAALDGQFAPVLTDADRLKAANGASESVAGEPANLAASVATVWERAYSRAATEGELKAAVGFVRDHVRANAPVAPGLKAEDPKSRFATALAHLSQTLTASNEFLYVD
jgi:hypothetical protein